MEERIAVLERLLPDKVMEVERTLSLGRTVLPIRVMTSPPTVGTRTTSSQMSTGKAALDLNGTDGNYATTPDHTDLDITGDIEFVVRLDPDAIGTSDALACKGGAYRFIFDGANNQLMRCGRWTGSAWNEVNSTSIGWSAGVGQWLKITRVQSSGAVAFYKAADSETEPTSWTACGTGTLDAGSAFLNSTGVLELGARDGGFGCIDGRFKRFILRAGIAGTVKFDIDFTTKPDGATSVVDATGKTVTLQGAATIDSPAGVEVQNFYVTTNTADTQMNPTFFRTTVGGDWIKHGSSYPNYFYAKQVDASSGAGSVVGTIEFIVDSAKFEIMHKGETGYWRMWVDGELVSETPVSIPNDGNLYWQPITFATKAIRHIMIDFYSFKFGGIVVGCNDTVLPATETRPKALLFGDSFGEGAGASGSVLVNGFVPLLSRHLGWDIWGAAQGGSGYVAAGSFTGKYSTRVSFFDGLDFDVIILTGGHNDMTVGNSGSVATDAESLVRTLRQKWPNALIIMCAPFTNRGVESWDQYLFTVYDALKSVAAKFGLPMPNLLEMPFDEGVLDTGTLNGSTSIGAFSISVTGLCPPVGSTIEIDTGNNRERRIVFSVSGTGPFTCILNSTLAIAHSNGVIVSQVGGCMWTGHGRIGAETGYGSCDLYVSSDTVHPSPDGYKAIARNLAEQIRLVVAGTDLGEQV